MTSVVFSMFVKPENPSLSRVLDGRGTADILAVHVYKHDTQSYWLPKT